MVPCSKTVTPSRFERRLPPGELEAAFKFAFGSFGKAGAYFHVTRQTIARWARLSPFPPPHVLDVLKDIIQQRMSAANDARNELNLLLQRPPRPPRPLSGCTAKYTRVPAKGW
jgi:hypothetical protein